MFSITVLKRSKVAEGLLPFSSNFIGSFQNLTKDQKAEFTKEFRKVIIYGDQLNLFDYFTGF